ncbi:SusC/RagA family TonB-linked outer membrane protein [Algoriphagus aquimarinus]|uniref:TonB-linked outer membrane protein, SusC/RagA family n=1 Tax=Algoriphagus aquimarinus TaxID=237018 RepID=A0A1I0XZF3_9BACT|nr:TonB-dependent receptor [Algoriphagus aquimarinus]SFB05776.1 TonB-linked outer membrane protein, SusC/RagA family [Algoriphagus aquimarinus]
MMRKLFNVILVSLLSMGFAFAQGIVSGTVTDQNGKPLDGVSILEKGTSNYDITNPDGSYQLKTQNGAVLVFTLMGYGSKEMPVGKQSIVNVQLISQDLDLEEVVVIGYQTLRKSDLTGAVSNLKAKDLNLTTPTLGQALTGKIAGVQVSQVSGAPYETTKIRVRGIGSINASSSPLYVIDGYPAANDVYINPNDIESIDILKDAASAAIYGSRASGGVVLITTKRGKEGKAQVEFDYQSGVQQLAKKVDLLNSTEFVDLLIDARNNNYRNLIENSGRTWTDAMYSDSNGTRVSNVGNAGGVSIPTDFYDFANQQAIAPEYDTDWQDVLYRNAHTQRYNLAVNGGNEKSRYFLSGGYQHQPGIIETTNQDRFNLRLNVDSKVSERFRVGANVAFTSNINREVQEGRFNQGPILGALIYMPIFKAYNEDGTLAKNEAASLSSAYGFQSIENPLALASETIISRRGQRGTYNANASYDILKGLTFKANLGMQTYFEKYEFYKPTSLSSGANPPYSDQAKNAAYATAQTYDRRDKLGEFTLAYLKDFNKHSINALAGYTVQATDTDVLSVTSNGFENDNIPEITGKGADPTNFQMNGGTGKTQTRLLSYLARVGYNYDSRYYLTASFRRDGSSRFGPLNRYGNFPSLSAAWNISNEDFYNDWLGEGSSLKLRASWGLSGNNNIGDYNYAQVVSTSQPVVFGNGTVESGVYPLNMRDQSLGWESTSQFNVGVDTEFLNGRLSVIANAYLSRSFNLLLNRPISAISGATSVLTNMPDSKVENKGFDIQIDAAVVSKSDFNLNISGNISLNRNKVLDLGDASTILSRGAERSYLTHITTTGQPIGMFYGFKVGGMVRQSDMDNIAADDAAYNSATQSFPEGYEIKGPPRSLASSNPLRPGDLYFEDVNGDGIVSDEDKTVIGTPYADFTYGLTLSGNYRSFDFAVSMNGSQGNEVLDGQDYYLFNMEASGNQYAVVDDRFRSESEPGNGWVYKASRGGTQSNSTRLSTFYIQDGSFLRITNITVGYNVKPEALQKMKLAAFRIYMGVDNAFTFTKYLGYNPEVDYNDGANLTPGVDYGKYPLMRSYNLGVKVTF